LSDLVSPGTMLCMVVPGRGGVLAQMRKGALQYCVLALLRERERYAFDLVRSMSELPGLETTEGTLYPLLSRLRREGLVETTWQESAEGPPRRYYRVTDTGAQALEQFTREWATFGSTVDRLLRSGGTT
jgi:PadR family transcriptional regulator PadR